MARSIVGRDAELAVFDRALSSREYAGLVIHGRAGVGKTRLAEECRRQAAAAGHPAEQVTAGRSTVLVPLAAVDRAASWIRPRCSIEPGGLCRSDTAAAAR